MKKYLAGFLLAATGAANAGIITFDIEPTSGPASGTIAQTVLITGFDTNNDNILQSTEMTNYQMTEAPYTGLEIGDYGDLLIGDVDLVANAWSSYDSGARGTGIVFSSWRTSIAYNAVPAGIAHYVSTEGAMTSSSPGGNVPVPAPLALLAGGLLALRLRAKGQ